MHIKSILSAAVIALVAGLGTASAAGEFAVLDGLPAEAEPRPATKAMAAAARIDLICMIFLPVISFVGVLQPSVVLTVAVACSSPARSMPRLL